MEHQEIQELLVRYRQGMCSEEEVRTIHLWFERLNPHSTLTLTEAEQQALEAKLWHNLQATLAEESVPPPVHPVRFPFWQRTVVYYSGAAALVLLTVTYWLFLAKTPPSPGADPQPASRFQSAPFHTYTNPSDTLQPLTLSDHSVVLLSPGSSLHYPAFFSGHQREVELVGDAFFEVVSKPDQPFFIYSGKLVTRVLGTSFWVRAEQDQGALTVEVVTGKVSVFERVGTTAPPGTDKAARGVVLTPNQRATYYPARGQLLTSLVEEPTAIASAKRPGFLLFNETPLREIIRHLQRAYGIEMDLAHDDLEDCAFTGDVAGIPLYDALNLICRSNGLTYEVTGTRILISGPGCQ
ncbi:hypothetical protein GCM10027275_10180 [Rhabdobacter roseus]|uniref:Ferric-dicitrate binding protein FerR (Iron transport regulator) n=1 Tax=Rhabdobacter roseus TaxID=1655419 RepID=A0A840TN05_9BACT|nr:FecR family protein [Rhabdobacter roseus]MBB5282922.1 ferric-dicitrate binding protein FerR (iron transport regulator) [Rhabdobacter roseus]